MARAALGAALRQIHRLFAEGEGPVSGLSDARLLERFLARGDGSAFEALVARHGPMVLAVCRGILRDPADAEDAFQATFLVLVKKARTIRGREALGGWLHRVAHRVAIQANAASARRRAHERRAGEMRAASSTSGPTAPDELRPALHEEVARLPEKYRLPVVLCDLQGLPQAEVALQLRWSERTLRRRLAEGHDRLRGRLARRGLAPSGVAVAALLGREASAAVPEAWSETTVRAALAATQPLAAGMVSAAAEELTREVLKAMMLPKIALASALVAAGLAAWAASAALAGRDDTRPPAAVAAAPTARPAPTPAPEAGPDPLDAVGEFPVRGRVLDPDGKPVAGAEIYVRHYSFNDGAHIRTVRAAATGADGSFRFALDKGASDFPYTDEPAWHGAQIAASATGFGPAWIEARSLIKGGEATLRLVRDDVPILGRVLDTQGRPVAGVRVSATEIREADRGVDLDALLASGALPFDKTASQFNGPIWLGREGTWTTDARGRFEVRGVGRDRIVGLEFRGPALETKDLYAAARPSKTPPKPRPRPARSPHMLMGPRPAPLLVGSTFEHVVGPTKPIHGVVRLKGTGKPVAGVLVWGIEPATRTTVSASTDTQGRFRLVGLPKADSYHIRVEPKPGIDPFLGIQVDVSDTEGLKPIEMALEPPRGVIVTGRLIDKATGRPVPAKHAHHTKLPTNPTPGDAALGHSGPTDPTFRLTVPPGAGMIYANVRGQDTAYTRARLAKADKGKGIGGIGDDETLTIPLSGYHAYRIVDVPAGAPSFSVDLELTRGVALKGTLLGPDGKPVAGAQCYGLASNWGQVRTLADATFEVLGLEPGHPRLVVFAHKGRRLVGSVTIKDEHLAKRAPLEVRLGPAGSVKGRLVDEDGLPLAGASLSVMTFDLDGNNLPSGPSGVWPDDEAFAVDADGRFEVVGLKPGVKSSIGISAKTRPDTYLDAGKVFRDLTVEFGGVRDLGELKAKVVSQSQ